MTLIPLFLQVLRIYWVFYLYCANQLLAEFL